MKKARKGQWVEVRRVILRPEERTAHLPQDTREVPFEAHIKGFLLENAELGREVAIRTKAGRRISGVLEAVCPPFGHTFGAPVPELLEVGLELRRMLEEAGE